MSRAGGGAASQNESLKFYQIMVTRANGTRYSSVRSEPFGDDCIEIFGINPSAPQIEKIKLFKAWMTLAQLAPVMPPLIPNAAGELQDRCEQLTVPFDVILRTLIFLGLPDIAGDRLLQALNFAALKVRPSLFASRENVAFQRDLFQVALDAALNADLPILEKILREASPEQRRILLSARGTATITHLSIERTGTILQMALRSGDDKMVEVIKRYMDPAEFQRQWEKVFGPDYNAFFEGQLHDATRLCSELENAFKQASPTDVTNALNHVANTPSALQDVLNRFEENLKWYVRENLVHNPYILQRLFEIYDGLPYDWYKECLLSRRPIGLIEKLSSAIWLSHIADGVCDLDSKASLVEPSRGFLSQNKSTKPVDVRTLDRLGFDCVVDIYGRRMYNMGFARRPQEQAADALLAFVLQNLRTKTTNLQNLLRCECNRLSA